MVTCKEVIMDLLYDYLDKVLGSELEAELEAHLEVCPPCRAYLATYRKTREIAANAARPAMPEEMKDRLRQFLLKKLAEGNP